MITTLNPRICLIMIIITLIGISYNTYYSTYSIISFFIGIFVTYPITKKVWIVIETNWRSVYKKFYSSYIFKRKSDIAKKSWGLTWWLVPYCIIVYLIISFLIIYYTYDAYILESLSLGSIFTVFAITYNKSSKYYRQIK